MHKSVLFPPIASMAEPPSCAKRGRDSSDDDTPDFFVSPCSPGPDSWVEGDRRANTVKSALWRYVKDHTPRNERAHTSIGQVATLYNDLNDRYMTIHDIYALSREKREHIIKALEHYAKYYTDDDDQGEADIRSVRGGVERTLL